MAASSELKELVDRTPDLDTRKRKDGKTDVTGKLTGPLLSEAEAVYEKILSGGRDSVVGVIGMLAETDKGDDYKARYVLHNLAVHVCRPAGARHRAAVVDALVSQLAGDRPKSVQAFLVRQLQVCGDQRAAEPLGALLGDDDLCEPAAQALLAIGDGAVEQFRSALRGASGPRRLTIVQALGVLRDRQSLPALKAAAGDDDAEIRSAAVWALANIADPSAVEVVLKAAERDGYERIQAAKACLLLAEKLLAAGRKDEARRIYTRLKDTRSDPSEHYLRDAAAQALADTR